MRTLFILPLLALLLWSCGGTPKTPENPVDVNALAEKQPEVHGTKVESITLTNPLDGAMVAKGKDIYGLKCQSCHKLTADKVVGPGWAGVTKKRKPEWIMNMITNVDMMLESDPEAQKLLELCLVRMPNQNISQDEARAVIEFMRSNDGEK